MMFVVCLNHIGFTGDNPIQVITFHDATIEDLSSFNNLVSVKKSRRENAIYGRISQQIYGSLILNSFKI